MLKPIKIFFLTVVLLFQNTISAQTNTKKIAGANVKTMYGEAFNTSKLDNNHKPMIVVIWQTDRRGCFQYLQALNEELTDLQTETAVKVVIISIDPPKTSPRVLPTVLARKWDFESYIDTYQEFKTAMGVIAVPYTFIVDGNKEVIWEKQGYSPGQETEVYDTVKEISKSAAAR